VSAQPPLDAALPWTEAARQALSRAVDADRLGHAVLLQVPRGAGGEWLARWSAARVLCRAATARPCATCLDCRRVAADQHPDCLVVQPLEDSKEIRVDQVREMIAELGLSSHGGARKVAILAPADRLNRNAANSLLKTLEEPTRGTLLLLVAEAPGRLPATVRSRCTRIVVPAPGRAATLAWLAAHSTAPVDWPAVLAAVGDRPLAALAADPAAAAQLAADVHASLEAAAGGQLDPVATAERWSRDGYVQRLDCIENWITDRVRAAARHGGGPPEMRAGAHLPAPGLALNIRALFEALDLVREARGLAESTVNKSLVLERLLWRLLDPGDRAGRQRARADRTGNRDLTA
jgi:DNA polymerase-3 subunit delta'